MNLKKYSRNKNNLFYYILQYNNFLDTDFCSTVIKDLNFENKWAKHEYFDEQKNQMNSYSDDLLVENENSSVYTLFLMMQIKKIIIDYQKITDHWKNFQNYSYIRYNRYDVGTKMRPHCDHIKTLFTGQDRGIPILTMLGSLNKNYTGGELKICNEKINLPEGSIIVFPSNFLYPHEVLPVKTGTRYSFVSWVW